MMSPKSKSKAKAASPVDEMSFEQAYEELERIVHQLEEGQLSLDDSLALFERGQALAARCGALLEAAELRIRQLAPTEAGYEIQDFDEFEA
jgi:exodeoxyribonuclease VII small subunit